MTPILMSGAMVRAVLREIERPGTGKTNTRRMPDRLLRFGPITEFGRSDTKGYDWHFRDREMRWHDLRDADLRKYLPYRPGQLLYVRETWAPLSALTHTDPGVTAIAQRGFFRADESTVDGEISRWTPSIHMPRWASRLTLEVTGVKVERLQDISEEDAKAEGVERFGICTWVNYLPGPNNVTLSPRRSFESLWTSINGPGSWEANPWIVAVSFIPHPVNIDQFETRKDAQR